MQWKTLNDKYTITFSINFFYSLKNMHRLLTLTSLLAYAAAYPILYGSGKKC